MLLHSRNMITMLLLWLLPCSMVVGDEVGDLREIIEQQQRQLEIQAQDIEHQKQILDQLLLRIDGSQEAKQIAVPDSLVRALLLKPHLIQVSTPLLVML